MRKVFESDNPRMRGWGIMDESGYIEYEPDFNYTDAVAIAQAHDAGVETYEAAVEWALLNLGIEIEGPVDGAGELVDNSAECE